MEPAARTTRLRRGVTAAAVSTLVALAFHLLAGGAVPGVLGVVAPLLLTSVVGMSAGGRRPSFWGLLATATSAQVLFHTLFSFGATSTGGQGGHGGHTVTAAEIAATTAHHAATTAGHGWMWQAHLVAGVVTAVTLHRGELAVTWLRTLLAALAARVLVPTSPATPVPGARVAAPVLPTVVRPTLLRVLAAAPRRGPPVPVLT
ncbi:hypothetical protein [Litorihabitans aurantiacus]|uniref:Uncharacterized protein n=1 Tax=Litorihabitans aurantiacus TaxID=1930061 RepID=A0AA37XHB3_9MICO|nr:hypothetical protein [Litorihabitans aurantiacus]GMA32959.1 hypothetical protein GCM10025875_29510 [Litorihabitans aurantiacus]